MRRLFVVAGILIFLSVIFYFMYLNNHKVYVALFGAFSIQLSLWLLIFATFFLGFFLSWFYQLIFHPSRIVQRTKNALVKYQTHRQDQRNLQFFDAVLRRDFKALQSSFNKLQRTGTLPLYATIQYLKQQRFQKSSADLLEAYQQLKQQFPNNLQVLLAYQSLAMEKKEWALVELLSQEILQAEANHPSGVEGLRQVYLHRQEWDSCVRAEIKLLKRFPHSVVAETLLAEHEAHLLKALQENPKLLQEVKLNHLPSPSSFKEFHQVALVLAEAKQFSQQGQHLKAAHLLKRTYEKTAAPVLLDELERIFFETGQNEKVLQLLEALGQSSANTLFVHLVFARIHYQNNQLEQAKTFLKQVAHHKRLPLLFHALTYLIALQEQEPAPQIEAAQALIPLEKLLERLYTCTQCGEDGNWEPICPRCHKTYSYVYKEALS